MTKKQLQQLIKKLVNDGDIVPIINGRSRFAESKALSGSPSAAIGLLGFLKDKPQFPELKEIKLLTDPVDYES